MLYNSALSYTVQDIQSQTGIEMSTLTQVLNILLKARVLKIFDPNNPNVDKKAAKLSVTEGAIPATSELTLLPETQLRLYTDYNKYVVTSFQGYKIN